MRQVFARSGGSGWWATVAGWSRTGVSVSTLGLSRGSDSAFGRSLPARLRDGAESNVTVIRRPTLSRWKEFSATPIFGWLWRPETQTTIFLSEGGPPCQ